jgi:hypothetical protein
MSRLYWSRESKFYRLTSQKPVRDDRNGEVIFNVRGGFIQDEVERPPGLPALKVGEVVVFVSADGA